MARAWPICFLGLLWCSAGWGLTEYRLGGAEGNSWQSTLSLEGGGVYVVLGEGEGVGDLFFGVAVGLRGVGVDRVSPGRSGGK